MNLATAKTQRTTPAAVIYDGECKFCCRQVARLRKLDWGGRLEFISLHSPEVARRFPDLAHERLMMEMVVVTPDNRRFFGAGALRYISRHLPTLWPMAVALHIPFTMPIWSWLYRQVAKRRYLFGRAETCVDGTCEIHTRG